tara:strand:+ start:121 stop:819 length:699 start_codon:yes stop_codon:yes gene_type:complete
MNYHKLAKEIKIIIDENLDQILELRSEKNLKKDNSYVSDGDILMNDLLKEYLLSLFNNHIYISEEDYIEKKNWKNTDSYIFVDPIDGTENFVSGLKEWGVGISIFNKGEHYFSLIYMPEMNDFHYTGASIKKYNSRINGLSSSISLNELSRYQTNKNEIRIMGCSMYNIFNLIKGSFNSYENIKGVNCWDILPGINLALESGCRVFVDNIEYKGQLLFPLKKYKVKLIHFYS